MRFWGPRHNSRRLGKKPPPARVKHGHAAEAAPDWAHREYRNQRTLGERGTAGAAAAAEEPRGGKVPGGGHAARCSVKIRNGKAAREESRAALCARNGLRPPADKAPSPDWAISPNRLIAHGPSLPGPRHASAAAGGPHPAKISAHKGKISTRPNKKYVILEPGPRFRNLAGERTQPAAPWAVWAVRHVVGTG